MTNSKKIGEPNLGNEVVPRDGGLTTDLMEDSNRIVGSTIGGNFQRQDLVTATDISEEMNRQ